MNREDLLDHLVEEFHEGPVVSCCRGQWTPGGGAPRRGGASPDEFEEKTAHPFLR